MPDNFLRPQGQDGALYDRYFGASDPSPSPTPEPMAPPQVAQPVTQPGAPPQAADTNLLSQGVPETSDEWSQVFQKYQQMAQEETERNFPNDPEEKKRLQSAQQILSLMMMYKPDAAKPLLKANNDKLKELETRTGKRFDAHKGLNEFLMKNIMDVFKQEQQNKRSKRDQATSSQYLQTLRFLAGKNPDMPIDQLRGLTNELITGKAAPGQKPGVAVPKEMPQTIEKETSNNVSNLAMLGKLANLRSDSVMTGPLKGRLGRMLLNLGWLPDGSDSEFYSLGELQVPPKVRSLIGGRATNQLVDQLKQVIHRPEQSDEVFRGVVSAMGLQLATTIATTLSPYNKGLDTFVGKNPLARQYIEGLMKISPDIDLALSEVYTPGGRKEGESGGAPAGGKVRVTNGDQTYMIDSGDLESAQKDGFQVVPQ